MAYSSGGLIQATDYNGFASTNSGANVNNVWGTGSTDSGWGQSALTPASALTTVTATQWAGLVNNLSSMGNQTGTTLTTRTAPTTGATIGILSAVNTDLTNCTTNRGNAAAAGSISTTWSGAAAKTTATGTGQAAWTITWTQTVTFPSADQARYFWNAGGRVQLNMSKLSTGTDIDADWNTFAGQVGVLTVTGRVNSAAQTIAGTSYTGFTRTGGTGGTQTTLASTTGWYSLTAGAAATTMFQLNNTVAPYTDDFITVTAAVNAGRTALTLVTTWVQSSNTGAGQTVDISGGTDTASPFSTFGTAPVVLCRIVPPSAIYLTNSWGIPVVASSVA